MSKVYTVQIKSTGNDKGMRGISRSEKKLANLLVVRPQSLFRHFLNFQMTADRRSDGDTGSAEVDMMGLISSLVAALSHPQEKQKARLALPFLFAVDHCFAKSGQGTVLTGTVLNGSAKVGDVSLLL